MRNITPTLCASVEQIGVCAHKLFTFERGSKVGLLSSIGVNKSRHRVSGDTLKNGLERENNFELLSSIGVNESRHQVSGDTLKNGLERGNNFGLLSSRGVNESRHQVSGDSPP